MTARQIEEMYKADGHVRIAVGARLTPLAQDWLKRKKVAVTNDPRPPGKVTTNPAVASSTPAVPGTWLWWCDGPCGAAKAALAAQARETSLSAMNIPAEPKFLLGGIKQLAGEVKSERAVGGILLVQSGAAAIVYANRCPSLRAIIGTCRDAVQQGIDLVGANVLVIETPHLTLPQVKNVLSLFVRMNRDASDDVRRQLSELGSCG